MDATSPSAPRPASASSLSDRQLIVVTGKGGVGKTALSALFGRALAARGRRTLVAEVDPRENLHQMLGIPPSGGEILRAGPNLWVQNLSPQRVIDDLVREQVKIGMIARRVLESPIYQHFSAGAPGLKEMAVLGQAYRLLAGTATGVHGRAPAVDVVVVDAPATGHGVALLTAPALVAEAVRSGPIGRMSGQVADLVGDPARTAVVAVTLAEEMPVDEVLELAGTLEARFGRVPDLLLVNSLLPPVPAESAGATGDRSDSNGPNGPAMRLWRQRRAIQERELARLDAAWQGPRIDLPLVPLSRGPELVAALARAAEPQAPWKGLWG